MLKQTILNLLTVFIFSTSIAIAEEPVDVTQSVTHLQCRAWGRDNDPYFFETMARPRNPGDPEGELLLVWSFNSIIRHSPIAYFDIVSVKFYKETKNYCVVFDHGNGKLCFVNGGRGSAEFKNPRGSVIQEDLTACSIVGKWLRRPYAR